MRSVINFLTQNHTSVLNIVDHTEYILNGLRYVGHDVRYSSGEYLENDINIFVECFAKNFYESLISLKNKFPKSKLYVVVTERISENCFNSADLNKKGMDHYADVAYWKQRYDAFIKMAPFLDGIISVSECITDDYAFLGKNIFTLGYACPIGYRPIDPIPFSRKDVDVIFTGTITDYRRRLLSALTERGAIVKILAPTHDFLRRHYHQRSKLVLGCKLSESTSLLSKTRAFYCLSNELPHVFEKTDDLTDLTPYVNFQGDANSVADWIFNYLDNQEIFNMEIFRNFRQKMPAYQDIFEEFSTFISCDNP